MAQSEENQTVGPIYGTPLSLTDTVDPSHEGRTAWVEAA